MCSPKRFFLPNEYCQGELLTGLSVLRAALPACTWCKKRQNRCSITALSRSSRISAPAPGFMGSTCSFHQGEKSSFQALWLKSSMLKLELKTSGIKAFKHPLPPDQGFWSILGAEHTRKVTGEQKSSCHACSAFTQMRIKNCPEEPICSTKEEIIMTLCSPVGRQHLFCPIQLAVSLFAIRALSKPRFFFQNLIHSPTPLGFQLFSSACSFFFPNQQYPYQHQNPVYYSSSDDSLFSNLSPQFSSVTVTKQMPVLCLLLQGFSQRQCQYLRGFMPSRGKHVIQ